LLTTSGLAAKKHLSVKRKEGIEEGSLLHEQGVVQIGEETGKCIGGKTLSWPYIPVPPLGRSEGVSWIRSVPILLWSDLIYWQNIRSMNAQAAFVIKLLGSCMLCCTDAT
jgi:hypothetical protein